jgi:hypothetical protein
VVIVPEITREVALIDDYRPAVVTGKRVVDLHRLSRS